MKNSLLIFIFCIFPALAFASGTSGSGTGTSMVNNTSGGTANVSVTAATPNVVITPTPGTGTFTIGITDLINAQGTTTPYTILSTDMGKTVTHSKATAIAETLPTAGATGFAAGVSYGDLNLGVGALTITTSAGTINGNASQKVYQYGWYLPISDGANWSAIGFPGFGTITTNALTKFIDTSGATTASSLVDNGTLISTTEALSVTNGFGAQSSLALSTTTFTPNLAGAQTYLAALTTACVCAIANPTNISSTLGQMGIIEIDQPLTATTTVTWGSQYKFAGGVSPVLSTSTGAQDYFSYYVKDSTHVIISGGVLNAK